MRGELSTTTIKSYLNQGQWSTVIAVCTEALKHNPSRLELYPYLGKALAHQGKFLDAIAAYQQVLGSQLSQAEIHAELGLLYSKQQELAKAVAHYQQAAMLKPEWAELQYNFAVVLHHLGNWEAAIATYGRAINLKPDYASAYFNLGVLYDQRGEIEAAIENYYQAIKLEPNYVKAYSNLGSILAKQKKFTAAIEIYQQGLNFNPTWATLHNNLGQVFWFNEQSELALNSFEYATILEPKMALAHHNLGKLWQQQGNYSTAIDCFERVIELEPQNVWAYSHCADALINQGNWQLALNYLRKIISLQPAFVKSYCHRFRYFQPQDLLEQARVSCAQFLDALQQNSDQQQIYELLWRTYFYLGDILFEYGGIKQAQIYYQQALQIQPSEVELYLRLGNCLAKQQRLDAAIGIYQMGLTLEPNHPQICFQLGKVLERQEKAEEAIGCYETVLQQQLNDSEGRWQQLPNLFLSEDKLAQLPEKIYHHTQDWIRDCQLDDFHYVQVDYKPEKFTTNTQKQRKPSPVCLTASAESDCNGFNCSTCMTKLIDYFQPVQISKNAYRCSASEIPKVAPYLPFVVTIPEGRAWIASQQNSWIICNAIAVMTPDGYLLGDLSRYYPWFLPGCPYQEPNNHTLFSLEEVPTLEVIEGKVALFSGLSGHVYYHWLTDILPRIEILRRSGIELETIDWFVFNNIDKAFQRETLNLLGIPAAKILQSDRHSHIQASELIVPSFPGYLDWTPETTIKFLRESFLPKINLAQSRYPELIYISRSEAMGRQIINEKEVIKLISKVGFQTVFLEKMAFLEQVALFASAKVIIAPHGSGLTNLIFCSPGTTVVELFSPHYVRTSYWIISQQLQLKHYYSIGGSFDCFTLRHLMNQNSLTEDILVDLDSLWSILKAIGLAT